MAESKGGRSGFLYFVVGALVVAVAVLAYFVFVDEPREPGMSITVDENGVSVQGEGGESEGGQ